MCMSRREGWCKSRSAVAGLRTSSSGRILELVAEAQSLLQAQEHWLIRNLQAVAGGVQAQSFGDGRRPSIDPGGIDAQVGDERVLQLIRPDAPQPLAGGKPCFAGAVDRAGRLCSPIKLRGLAAFVGLEDSQGKGLEVIAS